MIEARAGELGIELGGFETSVEFAHQADLRQQRHQRMRQRVVQVARQPQPLAGHGGVAGFGGEPLDAGGALGNARIELGVEALQRLLLVLQVIDHLGKQRTDAADFIGICRQGQRALRAAARRRALPARRGPGRQAVG